MASPAWHGLSDLAWPPSQTLAEFALILDRLAHAPWFAPERRRVNFSTGAIYEYELALEALETGFAKYFVLIEEDRERVRAFEKVGAEAGDAGRGVERAVRALGEEDGEETGRRDVAARAD